MRCDDIPCGPRVTVTTATERKPIPSDVAAFVDRLARACDHDLGSRLAGVFLIGSLAHGGYSERYSDIDIAVVLDSLSAARALAVVKERSMRASAALAPRLSLFWTDEAFAGGRFPLLDRVDYLDHGVALLQRRPAAPERPALQAIRAHLRGAPLRKWVTAAARFRALRTLAAEDHKAYLRVLLYPARFICTWETGRVVSNDDAVAYVRQRERIGIDVDLIERALSCRTRGADLSELFPERHKLDRLVRTCVRVADEAGC